MYSFNLFWAAVKKLSVSILEKSLRRDICSFVSTLLVLVVTKKGKWSEILVIMKPDFGVMVIFTQPHPEQIWERPALNPWHQGTGVKYHQTLNPLILTVSNLYIKNVFCNCTHTKITISSLSALYFFSDCIQSVSPFCYICSFDFGVGLVGFRAMMGNFNMTEALNN